MEKRTAAEELSALYLERLLVFKNRPQVFSEIQKVLKFT
jgi:hypothetical protein